MPFYKNLAFFRNRAGISQEALAEKLNVTRQTISNWESGDAEPDLNSVRTLSRILGVTADAMLGGEVGRTSTPSANPHTGLILFSIFMMIIFISGFTLLIVSIRSEFPETPQTILALGLMAVSFLLFLVPFACKLFKHRNG